MIEIKNLSKYYNNNGVVNLGLRNINLNFHKNEIVAIVGDSGSGKSTLLNVICGIDSYDEGEMLFKGNETSYFNQTDMDIYRKQHIGFIFQNYNIIDSYTVLENVMMPMLLNNVPLEEAKTKAMDLITKVGLANRINNKGTKLSGGEKQRCVIARALASDCEILACDEPTGNLDSNTGKEIIKLIKEVAKDKLVLIVTHNYEEVEDIVTRKIKIADGTVVEDHVIAPILAEEENEEVNFSSDNISKKNLIRLALNNIKSTPRKTIFTFTVFLFISLIAFYLYLTCMDSSQVSVFNPDTSFSNYAYNRLVIFNHDHSPITSDDYKSIKGVYYENAYYEDLAGSFTIVNKEKTKNREYYFCYTRYNNINYDVIGGKKIESENDVFLILPREKLDFHTLALSNYIDGELLIGRNRLDIVGLGVSDYVKQPTMITGKDVYKEFCSVVYLLELSGIYIEPETGNEFEIIRRNGMVTKPTIYSSKKIDFDNVKLMLGNIYPLKNPDNFYHGIAYTNSSMYIIMPYDYEYEFDNVYEVVIYADKPNEAYDQLEEMGYTVLRPSIDFKQVSQNQLLFITYVVISVIIIMVLAFVSYTILSRIYISKNKDYTVFRTLGVIKDKMDFVVSIEIMTISLVASIVSFILLYVLYYLFNVNYLNIVVYNNLTITVIYYITMFLFTLFITKRFNKRLFKYSVQTSFKGEVVRND